MGWRFLDGLNLFEYFLLVEVVLYFLFEEFSFVLCKERVIILLEICFCKINFFLIIILLFLIVFRFIVNI